MKKLNKKSQVMVGVMISFWVFIVMVQLIAPMKESIVQSRSVTGLDCTNSSITTGAKVTCVVLDSSLFYWFGTIIFSVFSGVVATKGAKLTGV
jgi:hypothetical protein